MKKVALITVATLIVLSSAACIGKGKAPPPPPIAPVITKG